MPHGRAAAGAGARRRRRRSRAAVRELLALPAQEGFVRARGGRAGGSSSLRRLVEAARQGHGAALLPRRGAGARRPSSARCWPSTGSPPTPTRWPVSTPSRRRPRRHPRRDREARPLPRPTAPGRRVALADVAAVVGDSSALGIDDAVHAALLGDRRELERALDRLLAEGEAPHPAARASAATSCCACCACGPRSRAARRSRPRSRRPGRRLFRGRSTLIVDGAAPLDAATRWSRRWRLLQAAELRCRTARAPGGADLPRRLGAARPLRVTRRPAQREPRPDGSLLTGSTARMRAGASEGGTCSATWCIGCW